MSNGAELVSLPLSRSPRAVWLRRSLAFCAALAVALAFRTEHLTDWDAWDYTAQAILGQSSDLFLGRWWFIATLRGAYLLGRALFGLTEANGYLALQAVCSLCMAGAVVAGMAWTYRLTRSAVAEVLFALLILLGPMFDIYASAVMTEAPTLFLVSLSFWAWSYACDSNKRQWFWALMAGLLFGIMVSMREQAVVFAAWPIGSCWCHRCQGWLKRWGVFLAGGLITLGIGIVGAWAWYPWPDRSYFQNILQWISTMATDRQRYPLNLLGNLYWLSQYAMAASPTVAVLSIPAAIWALWKKSKLRWLVLATLPYLLTLLINHDFLINPRYVLPMMWMLAPVAAAGIDTAVIGARRAMRLRQAAAVGGVLVVTAAALICGWHFVVLYHFRRAESLFEMYKALADMPADATVVAGSGTPVACYMNRLGWKDFDVIASGWAWPREKLPERIDQALQQGREVHVNLHQAAWGSNRDSGEGRQIHDVVEPYRKIRQHPPFDRVLPMTASCRAEQPRQDTPP